MPKARAYRDRLPVSAREILGEFFLAYGHEITNALAGQADRMRQAAADAGAGAAQPDAGPKPAAPGTISVRPTQGGFARMAEMFTEAAGTADAARRAFEELCGEYDDEENT